ncbi:hypothetical protein J6TS1_41490 [Siminovitchia terrae]|uniref:Uncharacterized protein n=1 Tax=Siminovitchia terrae TaxID=1914933 RepID=A0ABQ4L2X3_SIMTE|nr:hypothetical protein J22TS1_31460 [Siminovitchia terrae]GIN98279.1 hypothetical protein J6TS1_41490 [Siminovitchia terrae]
MKRQQINIRISQELKEEFYSYCKKDHLKPSRLIRHWIKETIEADRVKNNRLSSK